MTSDADWEHWAQVARREKRQGLWPPIQWHIAAAIAHNYRRDPVALEWLEDLQKGRIESSI